MGDAMPTRRRISTINLILIALVVMMLAGSFIGFRMRMIMSQRIGLILFGGLGILLYALARLGGEHKARRLDRERRRKQLEDGKSNRKRK